MRNTLAFMLLGATLALACDDRASRTTTTSSPSSTSATEDLKQAGRELGSAAEKAGRAVKDEAKREAKDLKVQVSTSATDGGH